MVRVQRNILGVAGEYFVAAEMSRRGLIATLTLKNTPQVDCIALKPGSSKAVYLQVKTRQTKSGWPLSDKIEKTVVGKNHFVVFVDLSSSKDIDYYIVPHNLLARQIKKDHQKWTRILSKTGQKHKDTSRRVFEPRKFPRSVRFKNNWRLLTA